MGTIVTMQIVPVKVASTRKFLIRRSEVQYVIGTCTGGVEGEGGGDSRLELVRVETHLWRQNRFPQLAVGCG